MRDDGSHRDAFAADPEMVEYRGEREDRRRYVRSGSGYPVSGSRESRHHPFCCVFDDIHHLLLVEFVPLIDTLRELGWRDRLDAETGWLIAPPPESDCLPVEHLKPAQWGSGERIDAHKYLGMTGIMSSAGAILIDGVARRCYRSNFSVYHRPQHPVEAWLMQHAPFVQNDHHAFERLIDCPNAECHSVVPWSVRVNLESGRWKCRACQTKGDLDTLVEVCGLPRPPAEVVAASKQRPDTIRLLARRAKQAEKKAAR